MTKVKAAGVQYYLFKYIFIYNCVSYVWIAHEILF